MIKKILITFIFLIFFTGCSKFFSNTMVKAVQLGRDDILVKLLDAGVDPNTSDENGDTVLMWAVVGGRESIVNVLLDYGANVNTRDRHGNTVHDLAERLGNQRIIDLLNKKKS